MGIFRRKVAEEGPAEPEDADESTADVDFTDEVDDADSDAAEATEATVETRDLDAEDLPSRLPRPHQLDRTDGPYDRSEVTDLGDRLDFGALALQPVEGMELRLDVDEQAGQVTGVTAVLGESACQVQAFAAPKSSGIWDAIRDDIADGLIAGGGSASEQLGELGIELSVRIPARGADGRTTHSAARFAGVDGPRWFLRAVFTGAAALDDEAAVPLLAFVRDTVVQRGGEARAPRELLELKVPDAVAQAAEEQAQQETGGDTLSPFERGPEITEVR